MDRHYRKSPTEGRRGGRKPTPARRVERNRPCLRDFLVPFASGYYDYTSRWLNRSIDIGATKERLKCCAGDFVRPDAPREAGA